MEEAKQACSNAANAICEALSYLGDLSYAVLPRNLAHDLGDFKKTVLGGVRTAVEKEIEWIDERVAGGDRMREEWERRCEAEKPAETGESPS